MAGLCMCSFFVIGLLALPFAPEITLIKFQAKGVATPRGLQVTEWDGSLLNGTVSGTASVRWGDSWTVDGLVTATDRYRGAP